jgi:hypothetical protein
MLLLKYCREKERAERVERVEREGRGERRALVHEQGSMGLSNKLRKAIIEI